MTTTLSVRLDEEQTRKLDAKARALGMNKSDVIRQMVDGLGERKLSLDEALVEVVALSKTIAPEQRRPNRVLEARRKRKFNARLR